ncbi:MAG: ABC transporter permease [bacterium]
MAGERIIKPSSGWVGIDWAELWEYRELFGFLAWRDILVRYKQTAVGIAWAFIRPLLTMVVFSVIFGRIARLPSDGVPYPVLTFTALLPWQFLANTLTESSSSLIANASLVSKVYFPRLIIPLSAVLSGLADFLISLAVLIGMMVWYRIVPGLAVLWLGFFFLLALGTSIGCGLWLCALNVEYRDVRYVVPFLVQAGLYISPVGFSSSVVPEKWRLLYSMNPMVGAIDGFRWCLLGQKVSLYLPGLVLSSLVTLLLMVSGAAYFRRMEKTFADVI